MFRRISSVLVIISHPRSLLDNYPQLMNSLYDWEIQNFAVLLFSFHCFPSRINLDYVLWTPWESCIFWQRQGTTYNLHRNSSTNRSSHFCSSPNAICYMVLLFACLWISLILPDNLDLSILAATVFKFRINRSTLIIASNSFESERSEVHFWNVFKYSWRFMVVYVRSSRFSAKFQPISIFYKQTFKIEVSKISFEIL